MTKIIRVDPFNPEKDLLALAAETIRRGGIVAFPTETVYGLGADTFNPEAVKKIFIAKERPLDNPLIVHISSTLQLDDLAIDIPEEVYRLAEKFWPGPLTVVIPKNPRVPKEVTAGLPTIAIRMPAHPVALKLIELSGIPIAAPSANRAGRPSPTTAEHVIQDLYGRVDVIIDAGETLYGVESTIIDLTRKPPVLLRPGAMPIEEIEKVLNTKIVVTPSARGLLESDKALAPGMKYRHYAPEKKLVIVESDDYSDLHRYTSRVIDVIKNLMSRGLRVCAIVSRETHHLYKELGIKTIIIGSRNNMFEIAKNLFKVLRDLDKMEDIDIAVCEGFDEKGLGLAIMNRLRKASGYNIVKV